MNTPRHQWDDDEAFWAMNDMASEAEMAEEMARKHDWTGGSVCFLTLTAVALVAVLVFLVR